MQRMNRLMDIRNFALYYGLGRERELAGFDLAIVEPKGQALENIERLHDANTLVAAYVSVMEVSPSAPEFRLLKAEDFLMAGGRPLMNEEYGNYIVDLRSKRWAGLFYHSVGQLLCQWGYDGIFLDTIGDLELPWLPDECREAQMVAAARLLSEVRNIPGDYFIIQNNGFGKLLEYTCGMIDGVCWENPPFTPQGSTPWIDSVLGRLETFRQKHGIQVFLLTEEGFENYGEEGKNAGYLERVGKVASEYRFILYNAPKGYVEGINV